MSAPTIEQERDASISELDEELDRILSTEDVDELFEKIVENESWPWEGNSWGKGEFDDQKYDPELRAAYERLGWEERSTTIYEPTGAEIIDPFDFENLRFIDSGKARDFAARLEAQNTLYNQERSEKSPRKIVGLLGTGGTIAMVKEEGVLVPKLDASSFLKSLSEEAKEQLAVDTIELPKTIDSSEMKMDFISDLVITMTATWNSMSEDARRNFAGFMITHGTDTMAASAAMVTEMLGPNCPFSVALVGAQKTIEDKKTDVHFNIRQGFETLSDLHDEGVVARTVVMGGSSGAAYHASGVMKKSDSSILAMDTDLHNRVINFDDFGEDGIDEVYLEFEHNRKQARNQEFMPIVLQGPSSVEFVEAKPNSRMRVLSASLKKAAELGQQAVVLVTYGGFTSETRLVKLLERAKKDYGLDVFAANPFPEGKTSHEYGSAVEIRNRGLVPVQYLKFATEYKYMVARQIFGNDHGAVRAFMEYNDYAGETAKHEKIGDEEHQVETYVTDQGTVIPAKFAPYKLKEGQGFTEATSRRLAPALGQVLLHLPDLKNQNKSDES